MRKMSELSVLLITYNHEQYVQECLQSIVSQKNVGSVEVVVAEDCSTDATRQVIDAFLEQIEIPDIEVKKLYRPVNIGLVPNFYDGLLSCGGRYIIPISGDDYFYNPYVFEKLLWRMKNEPELVAFGSNGIEVENGKCRLLIKEYSDTIELDSVSFFQKSILGCGAVIVKNLVSEIDRDMYLSSPIEDWPFYLFLSTKGRVVVDSTFIGKVYRRTLDSLTKSWWQKKMSAKFLRYSMYETWAFHLGLKNYSEVELSLNNLRLAIFKTLISQRLFRRAIEVACDYNLSLRQVVNLSATVKVRSAAVLLVFVSKFISFFKRK